jgi:hypothetical protein
MSTFFSEKSTQALGCAVKAYGADAAYQAASELALLAGAAGFTTDPGPVTPEVVVPLVPAMRKGRDEELAHA